MLGGMLMLLAPVVLGVWFVHRLLGARGDLPGPGLTLSLGAPTGLGLFSLALFWAHMAGLPAGAWRVLELVAVALAVVLVIRHWRHRAAHGSEQQHPLTMLAGAECSPRLHRVIILATLLGLLAAAASVVFKVALCRHGEWDSWAVWNMHARFFFRDPQSGFGYLDPVMFWNNPDYPLLIPMLVLRGWIINGAESTLVPALLGPTYLLAAVGLLYFGLGLQQGRSTAALAVLILLSAPVVIQNSAGQLADFPLACNTLLTVVCCFVALHSGQPRYLLLAGLASGLAAWTKNEGLFVATSLVAICAPVSRKTWKRSLKRAAWLAAGLLPGAGTLALFWYRVGGYGGHRAETIGWKTWDLASSSSRHWTIIKHYLQQPLQLQRWSLAPYLMVLYPLVLGLTDQTEARRAALRAMGAVALFHLAQYTIFLIIPGDMEWYLVASLHRLVLQGFPSVVFVLLALGRPLVQRDRGCC